MVAAAFEIPRITGPLEVTVQPGASVVFVGANGSGKTRLAVQIEESLGERAHRIAAHRSLELDPAVAKVPESRAMRMLRFGLDNDDTYVDHRKNFRWRGNAAVVLLDDFGPLIQALFAEQSSRALKTHNAAYEQRPEKVEPTKLQILKSIWGRLLPQRELILSSDTISVQTQGQAYSAAQMSDGERAVFYMLGQALMAPPDTVLIIDEPELHVHPSILSRLWDEVQGARPDCSYVFITHDLTFAARRLAQKFVLRSYAPGPVWEVEEVPTESGFDEATATLLLGSRHPVLFVEGSGTSLDLAIYRACFPEWTVIARGSCTEVLHSVRTMRRNAAFTRVQCAGIIDADDYTADEGVAFAREGVSILPVAEIENLVVSPKVARAIALHEGHSENDVDQLMTELEKQVVEAAAKQTEAMVIQYCRRRIDRELKKIDLSDATSVDELERNYAKHTQAVNVLQLALEHRQRLQTAIQQKSISDILKNVDGKGQFMHIAATKLRRTRAKDFEDWFARTLRSEKGNELLQVVKEILPPVQPQ